MLSTPNDTDIFKKSKEDNGKRWNLGYFSRKWHEISMDKKTIVTFQVTVFLFGGYLEMRTCPVATFGF